MRPPWQSFMEALRSGTEPACRDARYRAWVRLQPCATCGKRGPSEVNHVVGAFGGKGVGCKTDDYLGFPQCRACHQLITLFRKRWEELYGDQLRYSAMTMLQAIHEGILTPVLEKLPKARSKG